jgi:predicted RND superfamily exporter protein
MENSNDKFRLEIFIINFTEWIIRYRWFVVIATFIITFLLASGARFLRFDTNYRVFFSEDNPQLQAFEEIQNIYTKNDNILFVLATKNEDLFTTQTMDAVEWLTNESWQIPFSIRVDAITNFQHTYSEDDDLIVEDLVENAIQKSAEELKEAKVIALSEPFLIEQLIAENAQVTGVNVTLQFPGKDITEVPAAAAYARDLAQQIREKYPELEVYISGVAMLNNAFSEASMGDMATLTPLMYVAMFLIMVFTLKSFSGTIATVIVITLSTMAGMGAAGWFNTGLTPPSAQAPTIIMTLAIADSIHILVTMLREMRNGKSKHDAIIESMAVNFRPVLLTSLSTIIGFLTMNFSDVPPFNHLGNITSAGVAAAFLISITFLPALVAILPLRVKQLTQTQSKSQLVERFGEFIIRWKTSLFYGGLTAALLIGAFLFKNELNDRFVDYFDESITFRTDTDFTTQNLTGIYQVQFSVGAAESGGISEPEYLAKLEEFANWYRAQTGVLHVNTFTDVMKRLNKNLHSDDESYYRVPDNRELAAQYLLLYEMSLPYGLDLNNQINVDKSATRLIVTLDDMSAQEMLQMSKMGEDWLKENAPDYMFAYGTGPAIMFSNISGINIRSMIKGSIIALLLISALMLFTLKSFKIGLISLVPNLMPAAVGFGLWGITSGRIDVGLSIVMGMTLGIVVDDSIHFLTKYIRARRDYQMETEDAVRYSFSTVGRALIVTSLILVAGFTVLSFSSFSMNGNMAKLTAITLSIALLADFIFLPPLLMKLEQISPLVRSKSEETGEPVPIKVEA